MTIAHVTCMPRPWIGPGQAMADPFACEGACASHMRMPWTRTHLEFPLPKVSIDTVQSEMERRRPESPHGPRPPCRHAPERVLDETENSRLRVWYVASYGQYEATCPTRGLEFSQGSRTRRDPKIAPCQREPLSAFYSSAPFFRLANQLDPQIKKHVTALRRFVLKIVVRKL